MFPGTYLKVSSKSVSNSWDITDIEFLWWWGGVCKVIFMSNPTVVLILGWGFDNYESFTIIRLNEDKLKESWTYLALKKWYETIETNIIFTCLWHVPAQFYNPNNFILGLFAAMYDILEIPHCWFWSLSSPAISQTQETHRSVKTFIKHSISLATLPV